MAQLLALGCFASAAALGIVAAWPKLKQLSSSWRESFPFTFKRTETPVSVPGVETSIQIQGSKTGFLQVLETDALLKVCNAQGHIENIQRQCRLSAAVFERDLLPALHAYCRFVQLMPASESHHHAHMGGLLAHTLEVLNAAMILRNAYLLPRGGGAEIIDAQRDHWTYAIFFAALFHDVGKPMTDLRIKMKIPNQADLVRWMPIAGSLSDCGATEYQVDFAPKSERDYGAHRRFPVALMQRLVSPQALAFIGRVPTLLTELSSFLSGESSGEVKSTLSEIIKRADKESTRWNLAQGPRNRFETARMIPLIERLMQSMRDMLAAGGALPLNRDGAIGWVYDESIWFVAKRLADTVREHVTKSMPADDDVLGGIPGPNKNDRLFDTWQEYGAIVPNPETGQSIWYVTVDGEGYSHPFTMLRFPLKQLFDSVSLYPPVMQGTIRIRSRKDGPLEKTFEQETETVVASASPDTNQEVKATDVAVTAIAAPLPQSDKPKKVKASASIPAPITGKPIKDIPPIASNTKTVSANATKSKDVANDSLERELRHADPEDDFMDEEDSAAEEARRTTKLKTATQRSNTPGPVTPYVAIPPPLPGMIKSDKESVEPSAAAIRFMEWIQQGIADGSMKYNETGAPVHFIEQGMLLVSPRIFRDFATQFGETGDGTPSDKSADKLGSGIQRQVINAGWNAVGPRQSNIFHFSVILRGGARVSKLAAVVILQPDRWILPVPPANPNIVPFEVNQTP